jgi:hypothetical protein
LQEKSKLIWLETKRTAGHFHSHLLSLRMDAQNEIKWTLSRQSRNQTGNTMTDPPMAR